MEPETRDRLQVAMEDRNRIANRICLNLIEWRTQPDAETIKEWQKADAEVTEAIDQALNEGILN